MRKKFPFWNQNRRIWPTFLRTDKYYKIWLVLFPFSLTLFKLIISLCFLIIPSLSEKNLKMISKLFLYGLFRTKTVLKVSLCWFLLMFLLAVMWKVRYFKFSFTKMKSRCFDNSNNIQSLFSKIISQEIYIIMNNSIYVVLNWTFNSMHRWRSKITCSF